MSRATLILVTAALAFACTPETEETDTDAADTDTDTDSDTDTDTDSDTDTDTDTDSDTDTDTRPEGSSITFVLEEAPTDPLGLDLHFVDLEGGGPSTLLASAAVTGTDTTVDLPQVDASLLVPIDDSQDGFLGAIFSVTVFEDPDESADHGADEPYVGAGPSFALWLEGVPDQWKFLGFDDGWNAVTLEGDFPSPESTDAAPIEINLLPRTRLTLGGTVDESLSIEGRRMAVLPGALFEDQPVEGVLYDEVQGRTFEIVLDGAPPADHEAPDAELPGLIVEAPLSYIDADATGDYSAGDIDPAFACFDSVAVVAAWIPQPRDVTSAFGFAEEGLIPGWSALPITAFDGAGDFLTDEQAMSLAIDGSCTIE